MRTSPKPILYISREPAFTFSWLNAGFLSLPFIYFLIIRSTPSSHFIFCLFVIIYFDPTGIGSSFVYQMYHSSSWSDKKDASAMFLATFALNLLVHFWGKTSCIKFTLTNVPVITRYSGVAVIGDFQEEQPYLLFIFQHNSMSNLLCAETICMNTIKNFVPLQCDSIMGNYPLI